MHHRAGYSLIELLIVIGIIATLAAMLLPAMFAVSQEGKITEAKSLLARIGVALDTYARLYTYYPPDFIWDPSHVPPSPDAAAIYNFQGAKSSGAYVKVTLTTPAYSPEALYYFLCHRFLSDEHPMLSLSGSRETTDTNDNGLPEVVDPWDRPFLYNRAKFPACEAAYYNANGNPRHNTDRFDLYSVGPDALTGDQALLPFSATTFTNFCTNAVNDNNDGNGDDDIRNWVR